jgi:hypothetical protein
VTILTVIGVGYAVGLRFGNGVGSVIGPVVLAIVLGWRLSLARRKPG